MMFHLDNYLQSAVADNANIQVTPSQLVLGETLKNVDEKKLPVLAKETAQAGIYNTPTLELFKLIVSDAKPEEYLQWPEMRYVPKSTRENFAKQKAGTLNIPASKEEKARYIELRNMLAGGQIIPRLVKSIRGRSG